MSATPRGPSRVVPSWIDVANVAQQVAAFGDDAAALAVRRVSHAGVSAVTGVFVTMAAEATELSEIDGFASLDNDPGLPAVLRQWSAATGDDVPAVVMADAIKADSDGESLNSAHLRAEDGVDCDFDSLKVLLGGNARRLRISIVSLLPLARGLWGDYVPDAWRWLRRLASAAASPAAGAGTWPRTIPTLTATGSVDCVQSAAALRRLECPVECLNIPCHPLRCAAAHSIAAELSRWRPPLHEINLHDDACDGSDEDSCEADGAAPGCAEAFHDLIESLAPSLVRVSLIGPCRGGLPPLPRLLGATVDSYAAVEAVVAAAPQLRSLLVDTLDGVADATAIFGAIGRAAPTLAALLLCGANNAMDGFSDSESGDGDPRNGTGVFSYAALADSGVALPRGLVVLHVLNQGDADVRAIVRHHGAHLNSLSLQGPLSNAALAVIGTGCPLLAHLGLELSDGRLFSGKGLQRLADDTPNLASLRLWVRREGTCRRPEHREDCTNALVAAGTRWRLLRRLSLAVPLRDTAGAFVSAADALQGLESLTVDLSTSSGSAAADARRVVAAFPCLRYFNDASGLAFRDPSLGAELRAAMEQATGKWCFAGSWSVDVG